MASRSRLSAVEHEQRSSIERTSMSTTMTTASSHRLTRLLDLKSAIKPQKIRWLNPEQSVGVWYRKLGKCECWEAKGPALEAFLKLAQDIKNYLERHSDPVSSTVIWSVYMIGRKEESAVPTIMFCCKDENARRGVRKEIDESGILAKYPGFKTGDSNRPPEFDRLVQMGTNAKASNAQASSLSPSACEVQVGRTVLVCDSSGNPDPLRRATIGTVFQLNDQFLFSTVAHVFSDPDDCASFDESDESDFEFDIAEDSESDYDVEEIATSFKRRSHVSTEGTGNNLNWNEMSREHPKSDFIFTYPTPSNPVVCHSYEQVLTSAGTIKSSLDYCLVENKDSPLQPFNKIPPGKSRPFHYLYPKRIAGPQPRGTSVLSFIGSRGVTSGMISGTPSFITSPCGNTSQEVWTVRFAGNLEKGDCGSAVVDAQSGDIHGHIVAGSPDSGVVYIVPAYQIFEHMRQRFGNDLRLSTRFGRYKQNPSMPTRMFAQNLTEDFREELSQRRIERLCSLIGSGTPISGATKNLPVFPESPKDKRSLSFRNLLHSLSHMPMRWEDSQSLDQALGFIPTKEIYLEATKAKQVYEAEARSLGSETPAWDYQDCVIRALLKWFKDSFFRWVNNPCCTDCGGSTCAAGLDKLLPHEQAAGVQVVELYKCSLCLNSQRFPRYKDPSMLLVTREGRAGEWTNCFGFLCRALGARVRCVWNSEDHIWTEVYSTNQQRWIHVDAAEGAWDNPRLYTNGWGKKLAYCIAFSVEGVADVTRRYVRVFPNHGLPRTRCPEAVLVHILSEINTIKRQSLSDSEKREAAFRDEEEQCELQIYVTAQLLRGMYTAFGYRYVIAYDMAHDNFKDGRRQGPKQETSTGTKGFQTEEKKQQSSKSDSGKTPDVQHGRFVTRQSNTTRTARHDTNVVRLGSYRSPVTIAAGATRGANLPGDDSKRDVPKDDGGYYK